MDLERILSAVGTAIPLGLAALGFVHRRWLGRVFIPKIVLAAENDHLKGLNEELLATNNSLLAQASGWRGAAEAGAFSRDEAKELIARIASLETYVPKFRLAIAYIQQLQRIIISLEGLLRQNNIPFLFSVPPVPEDLMNDLSVSTPVQSDGEEKK